MIKEFSEHYQFSIAEDYYYPIHTYTPATLNREQTHQDILDGIKNFSVNAEVIETSKQRKRGSDKLFLVADEYYVLSSRTGLEQSGNTIWVSKNAPDELQFSIVKTVFKKILERKFDTISDGNLKDSISAQSISVMTPRSIILQKELTKQELTDYFDDLADLTTELLDSFYNADSTSQLKEISETYRKNQTKLFREYTNFTPSIVSEVITNLEKDNSWHIPKQVDEGKSLVVLMQDNMDYGNEDMRQLNIVISRDEKIELIEVINNEDNILQTRTYNTTDELKTYVEEFMECTPDTVEQFR